MRRLSILLLILAAVVGTAAQSPAPATRAFVGGRLVDVAAGRIVDNATVVVRDGRIVAAGPSDAVSVPAGATRVALNGGYVLPGLISAHVHVSDVDGLKPRAYTRENTLRQLGVFARYGITTVWSLGGEATPAFAVRDEQAVPALARSRLLLSGDIIVARTAADARAQVARVAATKPDIIKIRVDDNLGTSQKMAPEVYTAVIEEAHARRLRVAAHVFYLADAKALLKAGADVIAHSVRDVDVDDEFIALMKARDIPYVPTLTRELSTFVYESRPAFFDDPYFTREADPAVIAQLLEPARQAAMRTSKSAQGYKAALPVAERNLARLSAAGVRIAMGTDAGPFPERFQGYFEQLELEMMVKAGMTPAQVLRSATVDAARAMRLDDVGRLTPGAWADFLVLKGDPLADIRNTRTATAIYIAGNAVDQTPPKR
ncbi:MAG TPA: amidohydrolase family protein [Luteitalea sp.]|nr:amidohydrolase family protein [Luteitalea sp.]